MGHLSKFFKRFEDHNYANLMQVIDFNAKHEYFELEDNYIGAMYKIQTVPAVNDEMQEMLDQIYKLPWPKDTFIQTILWATEDLSAFNTNFLHFHGGRHHGETNERLNTISKGLYRHINDSARYGFGDSDCRARIFDCYLVIKVPLAGKQGIPKDKELKEFNRLRQDAEESLNKVGLFCTRMGKWDWLYFMQRLHNNKENSSWRKGEINKNEALMPREQIQEIGGKIEFTDNRIHIDEKPIALLSPKKYPRALGFGDMLNVFSDWRYGHSTIWSNFMIVLNVHFADSVAAEKSIKRRRKYMTMQANNKLANWNDTVRYQRKDYDEVYNKIELKGSRIVDTYLQFMVFGDNADHLEEQISRFKKVASTPAGFELEEDAYMTTPMFLHSLPFGPTVTAKNRLSRYNRMPSDVVGFLSPFISSSSGNAPHQPIIPFVTRDMSMFGFNPFVTDGSMNGLVVAESGSGKSVLVQYIVTCILGSGTMPSMHLMHQMGLTPAEVDDAFALADQIIEAKRDGGMAFIIDVGRSYYRLCQSLGGEFIDFGMDMKFSLNPFPTIVEFTGKDGQAGMILEMLKVLADPKGELTVLQERSMMTVLEQMWGEHGTKSSVTKFAEYCLEHDEEEVRRIGRQLEPFCEGKLFGELFTTKKPPPSLDNAFIVCELEELKAQPEIQLIALMQIINLCYQHFFLQDPEESMEKKKRKVLIVDECWSFLAGNDEVHGKNPVASFLEAAFRRFRKVKASAWIITQMLSDVYGSAVGKAIAANCVFRCYLYQKSDTIESVKREGLLSLSDQQYDLLKSIRTRKNRYSEIYFQAGDDIAEVVRFYAPPAMLLLFSTDPADREQIQHYISLGYDLDGAINEVLKSRHVSSIPSDMDDMDNADELEYMNQV